MLGVVVLVGVGCPAPARPRPRQQVVEVHAPPAQAALVKAGGHQTWAGGQVSDREDTDYIQIYNSRRGISLLYFKCFYFYNGDFV